MSADELPEEMAKARALTSKPIGVDLLTALPGQVERGIQSVIAGGASIFVAGLGVPREAIDLLHANNVLVGSMCGKVRHAVSAVASGVDFVVAQGTEGGGHTGTVATMALVPQVVDAVGDKVPVVAAGGLFDGRGLAASLALGADAACNNRTTDVAGFAREHTAGAGVDMVFDHVGPALWAQSMFALGVRGRLVNCGNTTGDTATIPSLGFMFHMGIQILGSDPYRYEEFGEAWGVYCASGPEGGFQAPVDSVFALADGAEAQQKMERSDFFGKILLE
eukprot:gene25790-46915_t